MNFFMLKKIVSAAFSTRSTSTRRDWMSGEACTVSFTDSIRYSKKIKTDQMKKKIWDHLFQTRKKSNFLFKSSNIVNF